MITIDRPEARTPSTSTTSATWPGRGATSATTTTLWVAIVTGVRGASWPAPTSRPTSRRSPSWPKQIGRARSTEIDGCRLADGTEAVLRNVKLYKPIIAAIDGPCVAGGMEMLGGVDIRIATPDATFGVMEPKRGLFAGGGTTARLPRQLPFPAAMEFLLTAEAFPASRALELGPAQRDRRARRAAWTGPSTGPTASSPTRPLAVQATKESVLRGLAGTLARGLQDRERDLAASSSTEDAKEGPKAFAEKRPPNWQAQVPVDARRRASSAWRSVARRRRRRRAARRCGPRCVAAPTRRRHALGAIDSLDVVYCQSWPYDDPPAGWPSASGIAPARRAYSGIGGTTPRSCSIGAAERDRGAASRDVCAIVGGEALDTVRALKKAGERPAWSHRDPEKQAVPVRGAVPPGRGRPRGVPGVARPSRSATWPGGPTSASAPDEHRRALGDLFAPMTEVAAANPLRLVPTARSARRARPTPTAENRMVGYPYTKQMVAVMDVDMAAAVVVASTRRGRPPRRARRPARPPAGLGVRHRPGLRRRARTTSGARRRMACGLRPTRWRRPASASTTSPTSTSTPASPSSVHFALDALGLAADDRLAPFTVTGGLPYAGGAGSRLPAVTRWPPWPTDCATTPARSAWSPASACT